MSQLYAVLVSWAAACRGEERQMAPVETEVSLCKVEFMTHVMGASVDNLLKPSGTATVAPQISHLE